MKSEA